MAHTMLNTIKRQNRIRAAKQVGRGLLEVVKAVTVLAAIYISYIAILGLGSL